MTVTTADRPPEPGSIDGRAAAASAATAAESPGPEPGVVTRLARAFLTLDWTRIGWIAGVIACVVWWLLLTRLPAVDFHYYWAADLDHLYDQAARGFSNGTNYSPAFFQLTSWLGAIPLDVAVGAYRALLLGLVLWMCGPFTLPMLFLVPVESEIAAGNVNLLIAAAVVAGFRYPALWSIAILTKVTPGLALAWFALRGEWRNLMIALGVTAAIAGVSFVLAPDLWWGWFGLLSQPQPAPPPFDWVFWQRIPIVAAFIVFAGARRWPVAMAAMMALPVFYTISPSMLTGVVALARRGNAKPETRA